MKQFSIFVTVIGLVGCFGTPAVRTGREDKPLPSFSILLADSLTFSSTADAKTGQSIVLFYYSPTCPYCRAQMTEIIDEMELLNRIQFYVFTTWPFADMKQFNESFKLKDYHNIISGIDYSNFFQKYFSVPGVPYLAIYGPDKKLNKAFVGKLDGSQIKRVAEQ